MPVVKTLDSPATEGMHVADLPPYPGTPRWVYVFGAIVIVLVLMFVIKHLAGGGVGHHMA
jgi:hypothetical protein